MTLTLLSRTPKELSAESRVIPACKFETQYSGNRFPHAMKTKAIKMESRINICMVSLSPLTRRSQTHPCTFADNFFHYFVILHSYQPYYYVGPFFFLDKAAHFRRQCFHVYCLLLLRFQIRCFVTLNRTKRNVALHPDCHCAPHLLDTCLWLPC